MWLICKGCRYWLVVVGAYRQTLAMGRKLHESHAEFLGLALQVMAASG